MDLARDYLLYAEFLRRKDGLPKAKEKFGKALEIFKECNAQGWVEKSAKGLTVISQGCLA